MTTVAIAPPARDCRRSLVNLLLGDRRLWAQDGLLRVRVVQPRSHAITAELGVGVVSEVRDLTSVVGDLVDDHSRDQG